MVAMQAIPEAPDAVVAFMLDAAEDVITKNLSPAEMRQRRDAAKRRKRIGAVGAVGAGLGVAAGAVAMRRRGRPAPAAPAAPAPSGFADPGPAKGSPAAGRPRGITPSGGFADPGPESGTAAAPRKGPRYPAPESGPRRKGNARKVRQTRGQNREADAQRKVEGLKANARREQAVSAALQGIQQTLRGEWRPGSQRRRNFR